jgi:hypothetical protein
MNTLTSLIPDLFEAIDVVSRELVGFIPASTLLPSAARAAVGEAVRVPITPSVATEDVTPGQLPPDDGDQDIGNNAFTISKSKTAPFRWAGEEQKGVNNEVPNGGYKAIRRNQVVQAIRSLVNEIEQDAAATFVRASRATGTAGQTPFATNLSDTAQLRKVLSDNGAPLSDMQLVIDTTAGANMRSLSQLTYANEAGTTELREQGTLLKLHGFNVRESAGVAESVSVGTVAGSVAATGAQGATSVSITVPAGGTFAVLAGDILTIGARNYVVAAASIVAAGASGSVVLNAPGLMATASNEAVSLVGTGARNLAFSRNALVVATRLPALPEEGDMADDRTIITDPRSGLAFEFAMYKQYRRVRYEVSLAWGVANIKPEHSAILLG